MTKQTNLSETQKKVLAYSAKERGLLYRGMWLGLGQGEVRGSTIRALIKKGLVELVSVKDYSDYTRRGTYRCQVEARYRLTEAGFAAAQAN